MKSMSVLSLSGLLIAASGCSLMPSEKAHGDKPACAKAPVCAACPASVHPDSRNWSSLFNLDLTNAVFTKGVWYIDDKANLTANKDEAIWTPRDYENFVLDL